MSKEIVSKGTVYGQFQTSNCVCCEGNHHRFSTYLADKDAERIDYSIQIFRHLDKLPHGTKVKIIIETEDE